MKKIIMVNLLFLTINTVFALEKVRNYNEQIAFIFNLSGKFTVNEIGVLNYPENEYKMYKITYGAVKANNILEMLQKNNIPLENKYFDVILKAKNGAIYVPFYVKIYFMNIMKQATTGLYFNKLKVDEVFVFETPRSMNLERRKEIIIMLLEHITGIQARPRVI